MQEEELGTNPASCLKYFLSHLRQGILFRIKLVGVNQGVSLSEPLMGCRAMGPVFGTGDKACLDGIFFDISATGVKVGLVFNELTSEALPPKGAGTLAPFIERLNNFGRKTRQVLSKVK